MLDIGAKHSHELENFNDACLFAQFPIGFHNVVLMTLWSETATLPSLGDEVLKVCQHRLRIAPLDIVLPFDSHASFCSVAPAKLTRILSLFNLCVSYELIFVLVGDHLSLACYCHVTHNELERALELKHGHYDGKHWRQGTKQATQVPHNIENRVHVTNKNTLGL